MRSLLRSYGPWLTGLICLLVGFWTIGLILGPQLMMLDQSLWRLESPKGAATLSATIDRLYNDTSMLELDRDALPESDPGRTGIEAQITSKQAEIRTLEATETKPVKTYGLANFEALSGLHLYIFGRTLLYAGLVTLLALMVCYPVAYAAAKAMSPGRAAYLLLLLTIPYAINELLRIYAWLMLLDYQGVINTLLDRIGVVDLKARAWIPFLEHPGAVFAAMVYTYILFMVFPIYSTLETLDSNQIEAARDLGASPWRIHARVIIPHAKPGIAVGCIMTFMLSAGSYAVPQIMARGTGGEWFTQLIYRQFFEAHDWNRGAAYAFALLLACLGFILLMMAVFRVGIRDIAR